MILRVLFAIFVIATAVHIALIVAHEPFGFDAWNIAMDTDAKPFSVDRFFTYVGYEYTHSNPRIGQWFTYLAYKLEDFAVIATPLAYLALTYAVTVIGIGRWVSWRRGRDLALYAIAIGFGWFAIPRLGMTMFCRAYCANYLYGAAIQLWLLVPLRLCRDGRAARAACIAYGALGVIAGMCNENTGPTLIAFMFGYAWWLRRRGVRPSLVWAGAIGASIGFGAIFFAPGQAERYDGLATHVSLLGRLLQRGITANLDIFRDYVIAAAPLLALFAILWVLERRDDANPERRAARALLGLVLVAGCVMTVTLFVSPKLGPRFYLHSCALLLAAFVATADGVLATTRRLVPFVVLAVVASTYAGYRTLPLYFRLADEGRDRMAALAASARGSVVTVESYEQVEDSWWFLGDDFRDVRKRDLVKGYFDLEDVILRAVDLDAPLGVSDVRMVPRYHVTPASCLDQFGGLELGSFRGLDVATIEKAASTGISLLQDRIGNAGRLESLDVTVGFLGAPPPLPRATLLVARWLPDHFEAYAGVIERRSGKTREVVVPKNLRGDDVEIYIYEVGGQARKLGKLGGGPFTYEPWKRGAYWALACRRDECFVFAATRLI